MSGQQAADRTRAAQTRREPWNQGWVWLVTELCLGVAAAAFVATVVDHPTAYARTAWWTTC